MKGNSRCLKCAGRGYIESGDSVEPCTEGARIKPRYHNISQRRSRPRRRAEGKRRDQDLLDFIKTLPCLICHRTPSDPDHITTRGAGGDDRATNVWPLCHKHHVERHAKGLVFMVCAYPTLRKWLVLADRRDILEAAGVPPNGQQG